jgi:hypothetical protein
VLGFSLVTLIFAYALIANVIEKPEGIVISGIFVLGIICVSVVSRVSRTTELRAESIELDDDARELVEAAAGDGTLHVIANKRQAGDEAEYRDKEAEQRAINPIPDDAKVVFLEVDVSDPSDFATELHVRGVEVGGYRVLRVTSPAVPNALAAVLLHVGEVTGARPRCYFAWSEGHPLVNIMKYLLLGRGDTAPLTREVLREVEDDSAVRPSLHVGG